MKDLIFYRNFDTNLVSRKSNENPFFYVGYVHARICSIINEANLKDIVLATTYEKIYDDDSKALLLKVYDFSSIVEVSSSRKVTHLVTNYLYELASMFHNYYAKHRILTDDLVLSAQRLSLIKIVAITINNGLNLIGIDAPNKM